MQKGNTLLRNGKNLNKNSAINALFVGAKSLLQKTILFHCREVAQIISQIFNPCAITAIAKSGGTILGYFNIHENRELLEVK